MRDKFSIDGHKLIYHVHRVSDWLDKKNIYPIYMEISPSGACNHRCIFCSVDFMGYRKKFLDTSILKNRITEMGQLGLKSIMFGGEGEPFLHRDLSDIIVHTKQAGIDVAVTTNGVSMGPDISERILGFTEWIKISCNAGTPETYAKIHQTKPMDFHKVMQNASEAAQIRRQQNHKCTLGLQSLLLKENGHEMELLARAAREIGLDYFVVKPYTHHFSNKHEFQINYSEFNDLADKLMKLNTESFNVVFRQNAMKKWDSRTHEYERCIALPFWSYIDADGNVVGCSTYLKDSRFHYGNINTDTFQDIWEGSKRLQSLEWVKTHFNIESCKLNCRMDEINRYLWKLINSPDHVNFI